MPSEWGLRAQLRNALRSPGPPSRECEIPVRVRLDLNVGGVLVVDAVATGWRGQLVRVRLDEITLTVRGQPSGPAAVWVLASNVRRRYPAQM